MEATIFDKSKGDFKMEAVTFDKLYGVCIGSYVSEGNFAFFRSKNKTEAKALAALYKRRWEVRDLVLGIVEIPEAFQEGDKLREYATQTLRRQMEQTPTLSAASASLASVKETGKGSEGFLLNFDLAAV
jgi:hypothetical protein